MRRSVFFFLAAAVFYFFSCALNRPGIGGSSISRTYGIDLAVAQTDETEAEHSLPDAAEPADTETKPLVLTFAGDLMAHTVNFNMADYNLIYTDVKSILHQDDLSFVNVETPVCDALPLSTYPCFNVHTPYLRAAVEAGFDVFSFANNHTNDHGEMGIDGSLAAVYAIQQEYTAQDTAKAASKTLAFSGLKKQTDEPIRVSRISYQGWNILFCSVTELLNSYDSSKKRVYYSAPTEKGRAELLAVIAQARNEHPCDIFVLSLHLNEPEYIRTVSKAKKAWFQQLGEAGADIIWAHHPHVMQPWETITVERKLPAAEISSGMTAEAGDINGQKAEQLHQVFCMYSMGNFISGQRFTVRYDDPAFYREYTGDAVMLQLRYTRDDCSVLKFSVLPIVITQYNAPAPVVRRFTYQWIETLSGKEKTYFKRRLSLMHDYLPLTDSAEP